MSPGQKSVGLKPIHSPEFTDRQRDRKLDTITGIRGKLLFLNGDVEQPSENSELMVNRLRFELV